MISDLITARPVGAAQTGSGIQAAAGAPAEEQFALASGERPARPQGQDSGGEARGEQAYGMAPFPLYTQDTAAGMPSSFTPVAQQEARSQPTLASSQSLASALAPMSVTTGLARGGAPEVASTPANAANLFPEQRQQSAPSYPVVSAMPTGVPVAATAGAMSFGTGFGAGSDLVPAAASSSPAAALLASLPAAGVKGVTSAALASGLSDPVSSLLADSQSYQQLSGQHPNGQQLAALQTGVSQWGPVSVSPNAAMTQQAQEMLTPLREQLRFQIDQQIKHAELRLDPPELGKVELNIRLDGDRLHVQMHAVNPAVRDALSTGLERLRAELAMDHGGQIQLDIGSGRGEARQQGRQQPGGSIMAGVNEQDQETQAHRQAFHDERQLNLLA
ncbi:flagellar hook-length control protein FliK [Shewanella sp. AS16]|uniref:flagellar hook-length control protein FliK n=1 Tax=Shewanella sp. AS16 TaxID=2907625 RepID=UPI001F24FDEA|nr:flagellar hook-length control protein FliK [Shewanella sp. AS16]MCE9686217.1 flagellar hook-length control protein FliK [Shewanella sp. AS16]